MRLLFTMQKTVLLVEDFDDARAMLRLMIEQHGHAVIEAAGAYEAIEKAELHTPDLILVDIGLPLLDGLSLTKVIHDIDGLEHVPVVAVTAFRDVEDQAKKAGCAGVLYKPILENELSDLLNKHLTDRLGFIRTAF